MTLIDSNVLIDIFGKDPDWWRWSLSQMDEVKLNGPLLINDVIYAEISVQFTSFESLDAVLKEILVDVVPTPRPGPLRRQDLSVSLLTDR